MLGSSNANQSPILRRRRVKRGGFTILGEDPMVYPHTCLFPVLYMWAVITEWATQCFPLVNMGSTIETIEEVVNLLDKRSCYQVATAAPS
jgi:hypothetical protein